MTHADSTTLIFCRQKSNRLSYILNYIFLDRWNTTFQICEDRILFENYSGPKFIYDKDYEWGNVVRIIPEKILFENTIHPPKISFQRWKHTSVIFYNQPKGKIPFDILAATFFLISRYEEYLPFKADQHSRFPAKCSIAYKYSFLQEPVIDQWLIQFQEILFGKRIHTDQFQWEMTVDIDMIWKYQYKSDLLNLYGYAKDILTGNWKQLKERKLSLQAHIKDPFDCFEEIETIVKKPIYYFVLTTDKTKYDRNTSPENPHFRKKIKELSLHHLIGLHPSYYSNFNNKLQQEKHLLQDILEKTIDKSRQHYIHLKFPSTYQTLIENKIAHDYTMGYPDYNGFRASTAHPFRWYDLSREKSTELIIHPFQYMDATSIFYLKQDINNSFLEIQRLIQSTRNVGGTFVFIAHNYLLGDALNYPNQKQLLLRTLSILNESNQ